MSGVIALVSLDGRPVPETLAREQLAAIRHRGDGEPVLWLDGGVALGQAHRATTPEAEREILPLSDPAGRYHLIWDGRIDNRDELAHALGWTGSEAREATDADYVLAAYVRWGDGCVARLLGDWAIVIWDAVAHRLFSAKDPMGFRTLFYAEHDGLFAIGSEPLQVLQRSWLPPRPDFEYARRLMGDAILPRHATSYAGLRALYGGESCVVEQGRVRTAEFWSAPRVSASGGRTPREYVDGFIEQFDHAVRARVRSNRPVGVLFSGGLDSSYVLAVAAKHADVTAVSTYAEGTSWDEREYQELVVQRLGVPYRSLAIEDCWGLSGRYLKDAHFDISQIPPQAPMQLAQASFAASLGMGQMLGGDGGDEWLVGRNEYIADALVDRQWRTAWRLAVEKSPDASTIATVVQEAYRGLAPASAKRALRRLTGKPGLNRFAPAVVAGQGWQSYTSSPSMWSRRRSRAYDWQFTRQLVEMLGWRDRWCLERNALGLATPFYDLRVVEFLASTPDWVKRHQGATKYQLREALTRVGLPEIAHRTDKARYDALFHRGLIEESERVSRARSAVSQVAGVLPAEVDIEIDRYIEAPHYYGWQPWRLISAGLWLASMRVLQPTPRGMGAL